MRRRTNVSPIARREIRRALSELAVIAVVLVGGYWAAIGLAVTLIQLGWCA
jgi:hypothetical protein